MADFYIDLTAGNDAGAGTIGDPYKTFQPINNANAWVRGNAVYVKRGTSGVVNSGTRANIAVTSGAGRVLLSAYGDAAAPKPVINGGGSAFNPVWVRQGSGIDIEHLHVTNTPGDGFIVSPIAGQTISDVEIRDSLATRTGLAGLLGVDGFKFGLSQLDGGTVTNVRGKRLVARDCGGHGIKVRGLVTGAVIEDSQAIRCGTLSPSHGMGSAGHFTDVSGAGWSNISGNVWEKAATAALLSSVTQWLGVFLVGGTTIYQLTASGTPATPGTGEFGIGAANTLRINLGGVNPNTVGSIFAVWARPENVMFTRCSAAFTTDFNGVEGQGIYFDNGSVKCRSLDCASFENAGHGFYLNDCTDSGHYRGFSYRNGKAGIGVTRGVRTNMHGNVIVSLPGLPGIDYSTGNAGAVARMNQVVGASIGIKTNDSGTNAVAENENIFVACATRLQLVSSAGLRSTDLAALPAYRGNLRGAWGRAAITAAELVV